MSKPSSKRKKQAAEKPPPTPPKQQPGPKHIVPSPSPAPPTHIVLPLQVRDAMIRQLGEVPLKFGIEAVVGALRNAQTTTVHAPPAGGAPQG